MIIATIKMKSITEKRSELLQTLRSMTKQIQELEGCKSCNFYQDVENENNFSVIEEWETQEHMDNHLKSDMFSALIGVKSLLVEPVDVNIKAVSYTAGMEAVNKARGQDQTSGKKKNKEE
jgi:quinol monooxygenase YgiN